MNDEEIIQLIRRGMYDQYAASIFETYSRTVSDFTLYVRRIKSVNVKTYWIYLGIIISNDEYKYLLSELEIDEYTERLYRCVLESNHRM